jgi:hypothetical protein
MSCLGPYYNPRPTRLWSRVETSCDFNANTTPSQLNDIKMANKGNILQYKKNSAHLTRREQYAQLARGGGPYRTSTWATQTDAYSDPNIRKLKRVNIVRNINGDGTTTTETITCGPTITPVYADGGSLIFNVVEDPCTGNTITCPEQNYCNPTSASDVPGPIMYLCYKTGNNYPTYYPRVRRIMTSSGTKWPYGGKMFVSANGTPSVSLR